MKEISTREQISNYIKRKLKSRIYTIPDFSRFGTYDRFRRALSRLENEGRFIRV